MGTSDLTVFGFGIVAMIAVVAIWIIPHGSRPERVLAQAFNVVTRPMRRVMDWRR